MAAKITHSQASIPQIKEAKFSISNSQQTNNPALNYDLSPNLSYSEWSETNANKMNYNNNNNKDRPFKGTLLWFNELAQYGYIECNDNDLKLFFRGTELKCDHNRLHKGAKLTFGIQSLVDYYHNHKFRAVDVIIDEIESGSENDARLEADRALEKKHDYDYKSWKVQDIINWIVNLDRRRHKKYFFVLTNNMYDEGMNGEKLEYLEERDLFYLGIADDNDRFHLFQWIQWLTDREGF